MTMNSANPNKWKGEKIEISETISETVKTVDLQDRFSKFRDQRIKKNALQQNLRSINDTTLRSDPERMQRLREKFLEQTRKYYGVPYKRCYHEPGSELYNAPLFLDCCALVRQVVYDLREDFGFTLGPWNQSYQMDTLGPDLSFEELKPGDLIFWEGVYYNPNVKQQKHFCTHVEVYVGPGEQTIGSRWQKGQIQLFDSYKFTSSSYDIKRWIYKSIDPWLRGECVSTCPEHPWVRMDQSKKSKHSIFYIGDEDYVADAEEFYLLEEERKKELLCAEHLCIVGESLLVPEVLEEKGYKKINYTDVRYLTGKKDIVVWSQNYCNLEFTRLMKSPQASMCIFNHHPQVSKVCTKTGLMQLAEDWRIHTKQSTPFILESFLTQKVEDAVRMINSQSTSLYIEKHHSEFTQKHKMYSDINAVKEQFYGNHLNRDALDIHGGDILESDKICSEDMHSETKYSYVRAKCIWNEHNAKRVIQRYVTDVKLLDNRKFDLRTFILLTNHSGTEEVHFNPGFLRCCIEEYQPDYFSNPFAHVTNITKQRLNPNFDSQKHHIYKPASLLPTISSADHYTHIKSILKSLLGYFSTVCPSQLKYFELLAVDFLVDSNDQIYLIEMNSCPNLNHQSDEHKEFVDKMVQGMFDQVTKNENQFFEKL